VAKYIQKPVIVDAVQWFKDGDHSAVVQVQKASCNGVLIGPGPDVLGYDLRVPAFYAPDGWHEVSPGDWIVTAADGKHRLCPADIFAATHCTEAEYAADFA
jgi:hypothetical protein